MNEPKKLKIKGANSANTEISATKLAQFAEAIIRSDADAALRSQSGLDDHLQPSQDAPPHKPVTKSSLESLRKSKGGVRLQATPSDPDNLVSVTFSPRKKPD